MKKIFLFCLLFYTFFVQGQKLKELKTDFELSNYLETPNYISSLDFCKQLREQSKMVNLLNIGQSPQGRDIPVLILDKNGLSSPQIIKRHGKAIVFIQSCVHAGEPDGKDAGFMIFRDIIMSNKNISILDSISIVFMPIFNVDGHERWSSYNRINQNGPKEMGWRTTSVNHNLNRDYLKAEAKEMKLWLEFVNRWEPDFFIDCHTTDGADYQYAITYSLETSGNLDHGLTKWINTEYIDTLENILTEKGYPIFPYVIFKNWHDPRSGLINYASSLKLLNGYAAARNRISLLIETHMLKNYKHRVFATYEMIFESLKIIANNRAELIRLNELADIKSKHYNFEQPFALKYQSSGDSIIVNFKGVHYDIKKSDLTNSNWFVYDSSRKVDFLVPYYKTLKPVDEVILPYAYVVPPEIEFIEPHLKLQNIEYFKIKENVSANVEQTKFNNIKLSSYSFEGKQIVEKLEIENFNNNVILLKGSIIIPLEQKKNKLIAHLFEPKSQDSYIYWGYFNIIFEQKEYAESYVMEKMMREMMDKDSKLKAEFENKIKTDTIFANNSRSIYNWFYSKTPYWDSKMNLYPIMKIKDKKTMETLFNIKANIFFDIFKQ